MSYTPFFETGLRNNFVGLGVKGEKSEKLGQRDIWWLKAHGAFLKDPDLILSTHLVVDSCLQL